LESTKHCKIEALNFVGIIFYDLRFRFLNRKISVLKEVAYFPKKSQKLEQN